jgi:hypothetical protein
MYLTRDVFRTKPGKAKELVKKFKLAAPFMESYGLKKSKIMTDISGEFWTVIIESEIPDLNEFAKDIRGLGKPMPEIEKIMEGYHDLVVSGYREIFLIEE